MAYKDSAYFFTNDVGDKIEPANKVTNTVGWFDKTLGKMRKTSLDQVGILKDQSKEYMKAAAEAQLEDYLFQTDLDRTLNWLHNEVPKLVTVVGPIQRARAADPSIQNGSFYRLGRVWNTLSASDQKIGQGYIDALPIMRRNRSKVQFNAGSGNEQHPARARLRELGNTFITTVENTAKIASNFTSGVAVNAGAAGQGISGAVAGVTNTVAGVTTTVSSVTPILLIAGGAFIFVNRQKLGSPV